MDLPKVEESADGLSTLHSFRTICFVFIILIHSFLTVFMGGALKNLDYVESVSFFVDVLEFLIILIISCMEEYSHGRSHSCIAQI